MIEIEKIKLFLEGNDPQKRIVNIECGYSDTEVSVFSRSDLNEIIVDKFPFMPFAWAKKGVLYQLLKTFGSESNVKWELRKNGIWCKALKTTNENDYNPKRMLDGYNVLFFAEKQMSYSKFTNFFKFLKDQNGNKTPIDLYGPEKNFMCITPVEQYMIQSGKRYFKGFNEYDELLRCTWDIETTGLDPTICSITQIGIRTNRDYEKIIHVQGNTEVEKRLSERNAIQSYFAEIERINPDILAGHNSEIFDWQFILKRIELLFSEDECKGKPFDKIIEHYWDKTKYDRCYYKEEKVEKNVKKEVLVNKTLYKRDIKTVLKLGNESEYFYQTIWYGHTVVDSLHACRRAQAIDSNMKSGSLKYAAEYAKQKKQNRVYIPGDKISQIYYDPDNFILDESNGEWHKQKANEQLSSTQKIVSGKYIADRYLLDDLYEGDRVEWYYNQSSFFLSKMLPIPYQKVLTMGTSATWKFLLLAWSYENGLAVPALSQLKPFTGGLSRLLRVGFIKDIVKLDFNSLYPAITLTWDIFPDLDISGVFKILLGHILSERERFKGLKKEFGKKAGAKKDEIEALDKKIVEYDEYKRKLDEEYLIYEQDSSRYDKLQLPFKIFGNAFFGSYGAPNIFNWGDVARAEQITCTARQCLRLMVKWFEDRGFKAVVLDTDGVNFSYSDVDLNYTYIGKGLSRNTKDGKEYKGIEAYVADFNDLFMREKMGLGLDEFAQNTINFSRKNYADLLDNGKVKYVGNSIKSKKMPKYIEKFLENNILLLLNDDGQTFLNNYYDYIEKIFNYNIPLRDIASIGSIKVSLQEYKKNSSGKNKIGGEKAKQAWYELAIQHKIPVHPGDKIHYVNIGVKKSEGDVIKEDIYEYDDEGKIIMIDRVDKKTGELVYSKRDGTKIMKDKKVIGSVPRLNCVRIDPNIIESDIDYYGHEDIFETPIQYNAAKYIQQFNSRIKALLVCFHPDIRNKIMIDNPENRNYFTEEQCKLTSGFPNKEIDQDTLEALLTMEDKEIKFWTENNIIPPFLNELGMTWWDITKDYYERQELLKQENIKDEFETYNNIIEKITQEDIKDFYDSEDHEILKLDYFIEILKICDIHNGNDFVSKQHNIKLGTISDILEKQFIDKTDDEENNDNPYQIEYGLTGTEDYSQYNY
jgi:DNA polymerase elongation subunit (family B)